MIIFPSPLSLNINKYDPKVNEIPIYIPGINKNKKPIKTTKPQKTDHTRYTPNFLNITLKNDPGNGGDMISTAEQYIGQSLDALEGACGSPQGSSYEDDPETGKTGFHYYSNFTVSTTVDENGNEIVAGIW